MLISLGVCLDVGEEKLLVGLGSSGSGKSTLLRLIVLEDESFDRIVTMLENPTAPTEALRELMRDSED